MSVVAACCALPIRPTCTSSMKVEKSIAHRYNINAEESVNVFIPRPFSDAMAGDLYNVPANQLGGVWKHQNIGYDKLPMHAGKIVWETEVKHDDPPTLHALKPKLWLMGSAELKPDMAYLVH